MEQSGLLHHWIFPSAGDGAKLRSITPCSHGAPMAQLASRASHLTRSAPPALCLRRRSEAHRWSPHKPIGTELHARAILPVPTLEVRKTRAHTLTRETNYGIGSTKAGFRCSDLTTSIANDSSRAQRRCWMRSIGFGRHLSLAARERLCGLPCGLAGGFHFPIASQSAATFQIAAAHSRHVSEDTRRPIP